MNDLRVEESSGAPRRDSTFAVLVALAAIALGIALRLPGLGSEPFWFDEVMTIRHLEGEPVDAALGIVKRIDPPLYYAGMAAWIPLVGSSELLLRLPSLLAGCAALFALYVWTRHTFGETAAAIAALLLAVHPQAILYSQEARFYPFMILLGIAATSAWDRLVHGGVGSGERRAVWRYALSSAALFYMHFIAGTLLAAHAAHALIGKRLGWPIDAKRRAWKGLAYGTLLCVPYFLGIAYLYLFRSAGQREWIQRLEGRPGFGDLLETIGYLSGAASPLPSATPAWIGIACAALFALAAFGAAALLLRSRGERRSRLVLHLAVVLVPIALLAVISQRKSMYLDRYLIASLPSAIVLASAGFAAYARMRLALPLAVAAAACVAFAFENARPSLRKADWPAALASVAEESSEADLLLVEGPPRREGVLYPGDVHFTTCEFYVERRTEAQQRFAPHVVPLPFELLNRGAGAKLSRREAEDAELGLRQLEEKVLASHSTLFVALPFEPSETPDAVWFARRAPRFSLLEAQRGTPRVTRFQRLLVLRFEPR